MVLEVAEEKDTVTINMMIGRITALVGFFPYSHFKLAATRDTAAMKEVSEVELQDMAHYSGSSTLTLVFPHTTWIAGQA